MRRLAVLKRRFLLLLHTRCQLLILGFLLLAFFLEGFLPHLFDIE